MFENNVKTKIRNFKFSNPIERSKIQKKTIFSKKTTKPFTAAQHRKLLRKHNQKSQCHRRLRQRRLLPPPPVHKCVVVYEMKNRIDMQKINQRPI